MRLNKASFQDVKEGKTIFIYSPREGRFLERYNDHRGLHAQRTREEVVNNGELKYLGFKFIPTDHHGRRVYYMHSVYKDERLVPHGEYLNVTPITTTTPDLYFYDIEWDEHIERLRILSPFWRNINPAVNVQLYHRLVGKGKMLCLATVKPDPDGWADFEPYLAPDSLQVPRVE